MALPAEPPYNNRKREKRLFKNCVFKESVCTKKWAKAAAIRAVKTVAQAAIATIGAATAMGNVDWKYVAETERDFIRKRQAEGIVAAKKRGVRFGPREKDVPEDFTEIKKKWENGEISVRMREIYRRMKEWEQDRCGTARSYDGIYGDSGRGCTCGRDCL